MMLRSRTNLPFVNEQVKTRNIRSEKPPRGLEWIEKIQTRPHWLNREYANYWWLDTFWMAKGICECGLSRTAKPDWAWLRWRIAWMLSQITGCRCGSLGTSTRHGYRCCWKSTSKHDFWRVYQWSVNLYISHELWRAMSLLQQFYIDNCLRNWWGVIKRWTLVQRRETQMSARWETILRISVVWGGFFIDNESKRVFAYAETSTSALIWCFDRSIKAREFCMGRSCHHASENNQQPDLEICIKWSCHQHQGRSK